MSSPQQRAKRKGSQFETDVTEYARRNGFPAERLRLSGKFDEGDIAVTDAGFTYVFECKAEARMDLASYVREARVEAEHYAKKRGLDPDTVWGLGIVKRRGKPIGESYVITTLDELLSPNGH